jgi:hypothetical protein
VILLKRRVSLNPAFPRVRSKLLNDITPIDIKATHPAFLMFPAVGEANCITFVSRFGGEGAMNGLQRRGQHQGRPINVPALLGDGGQTTSTYALCNTLLPAFQQIMRIPCSIRRVFNLLRCVRMFRRNIIASDRSDAIHLIYIKNTKEQILIF